MKNKFYNCAVSAVFLNMFMISLAYGAGSGGFRVETPDAAAFGKGSAFVGEANSPAAIHYNPAGITQLKGDTYISMGDAAITSFANQTSSTGNETQARINTLHVPHFYATEDFGVDRFNFGIGMGSTFGSVTDWAPDSSLRYVATRSEITNIDLNIVAAYEVLENLSIAVGYKGVDSHLNKHKRLLQDAGANPDGDFNLKGKDIGHGYTLSGHYRLSERHSFGLQYKSEIQLRYRGETHLDALAGTYAAVFGGNHFSIDTDVDVELPKSVVAGYSFRPSNKWVFNFDVEWTDWSSIEHERLVYKDALTVNQAAVLNAGNPVARDWDNVWSFALGAEHQLTDAVALRGGYYYHQNAIPDGTVDNAVADSNSHGITGGVGYKITDDLALDLAYSALLFEDRTINSPVSSTIDGDYEQWISIGMATLTWKY
ncbi:MAG: long-chain fatty acid transport protein [Lysobacterales bacterium]|jgi:long-chain fatty acid transport protein